MANAPYWMLAAQSAQAAQPTTTTTRTRQRTTATPNLAQRYPQVSPGQRMAQANQDYARMQQQMEQPMPQQQPQGLRLPSWMTNPYQNPPGNVSWGGGADVNRPTNPGIAVPPTASGGFWDWLRPYQGQLRGPAMVQGGLIPPGTNPNKIIFGKTQRAGQTPGVPWSPPYVAAPGTSWGGTPDILRDRLPTIGGNRSTNFEDDRRQSYSDYLRGTARPQSTTPALGDTGGSGGGGNWWSDWGWGSGGGGGGGYSTAKDVGAWARLVSWNIK